VNRLAGSAIAVPLEPHHAQRDVYLLLQPDGARSSEFGVRLERQRFSGLRHGNGSASIILSLRPYCRIRHRCRRCLNNRSFRAASWQPGHSGREICLLHHSCLQKQTVRSPPHCRRSNTFANFRRLPSRGRCSSILPFHDVKTSIQGGTCPERQVSTVSG
jgi:hypothetical protein